MIYQSEETKDLDAALAVAQGAYNKPYANEKTNGKEWANLESLLDAVRKPLSENGLSFRQREEYLDESMGFKLLRTTLAHSSGQWTSSIARVMPAKALNLQGNSMEIVRRGQAALLLGLALSKNDPIYFDDDGERQYDIQVLEDLKKPSSEKKVVVGDDHGGILTNDHYHDILTELDDRTQLAKNLISKYGVESIADLPDAEYRKILIWIREIKANEEKYLKRK